MADFYTILTTIGKAIIANKVALGGTLNITELAVGDGNGEYYNPSEAQTELVNEVWRDAIKQISIDPDNGNWVVIEAVIPTTVGGWYVREVGIFDEDGHLIAIGKYPETYKPELEAGSGKDLYIRMILEISNASVVNLLIDPAIVLASRKYVDDSLNAAVNPHDHSGAPGKTHYQKLTQVNSHESADTDAATTSIHHTLGTGQHQAAPGNHNHSLNSLGGLALASLATGDILRYNGSAFANVPGHSQLLAFPGWQKLPGGLILQWGDVNVTDNVNGSPVTFPVAFPNTCLLVLATDVGPGAYSYGCGNLATTGCTIYCLSDGGARWLAIGH
jgi:hypothetical protein